MKKAHYEQLRQIFMAGNKGVWAGDLMDKCSTRELIRYGLVDNSGGSPSSIDVVKINLRGRQAIEKGIG